MVQFIETGDLGLLPFEDGTSDDDIILELDRLRAMPQVDPMGPFGSGLQSSASAIDAVLARSFYGLGFDETAKRYEDSAKEREADISLNFRPEVGQFSDIDEASDVPEYIWNLIGQSAPETGAGLGGAAIGAILGTMLLPGPGTAAGALIGGGIGGTAAVTPFFAGRNLQAQAEKQDIPLEETNLGKATAFAVAQGSLDALLNTFLVTKIIPVGVASRIIGQEGKKGLRKLAGRLIVGAMEGAAIEAPTELSQEFLEMVQAGEWDGLSKEDKARLTEAAIGGGILGGLLGGAGNVVAGAGNQPHVEVKPDGSEDESEEAPLRLPPSSTPLLQAPSTIYSEGPVAQPQIQAELDFAASDVAAGEFEARSTPDGYQFFRSRGDGEQVLPIRVATEEEAIATITRLNENLETQREDQRRTRELSQAGTETTRGGIGPVELEGPEPTLRQDELRRIKERRQQELNQLHTAVAARDSQGRDFSDLAVEIGRREAEIAAPASPDEVRRVLGPEAVERVRVAQMPLTQGTGAIIQPEGLDVPEVDVPSVRASEFQVAAGRARLAASDQVGRGRQPLVTELDLVKEIRQSTGALNDRAREILQELEDQTVITREGKDFRVDIGPSQPVQPELAEPQYEVAEQAARAQGEQREGYGVFSDGRAVTPLFPTRKEALTAAQARGLPASSVQGARSIYALVQRDPETGRVTAPVDAFNTREEADKGLRDLQAAQPLPPVAGPGIPIRTGTSAGAASPQAPQVAGAVSPGVPARPPRRREQTPLLRDLRQYLDVFGLSDVNLQLMPEISGSPTAEGVFIDNDVNRVIRLATRGQTKEQLAAVIDHETIHALRNMGVFTNPEWQALVNYATNTQRPGTQQTFLEEVLSQPAYANNTPEIQQEEAVAEAFRFWATDKVRAPGRIGAIFRKIARFFRGLSDAFGKRDATSAAQVFEAIRVGEIGARPRNGAGPVTRQRVRAADQLYPAGDFRGFAAPKNILGKRPSIRYSSRRPPNLKARRNAEAYRKAAGISKEAPRKYIAPKAGYLERLGKHYSAAPHDPSDPQVKAAYRSLIKETAAQYGFMPEMTVEPWYGEGEPYANSAEAMADIADGHLYFFLTDNGFGEGENNTGHPMMQPSGIEASDGRPLLNNDIFRIVHDYFGHSPRGVAFSGEGEYNAYLEHSRMYSDNAIPALAAETLLQNAWVNAGPHMRREDGTLPQRGDPDFTPPRERAFAEQKAIFVPSEVLEADPNHGLYSVRRNPIDTAIKAASDRQSIIMAEVAGFPAVSNYISDRHHLELFGFPAGAKTAVAHAEKLMATLENAASAETVAVAAVAGRGKRGWYQRSAEAIVQLFGPIDAPRFAALVAAGSPQTSIESNLLNSINIWVNWIEAGRPQDQDSIVEVMGNSVERTDLSLASIDTLKKKIDRLNNEFGHNLNKRGKKDTLVAKLFDFANANPENEAQFRSISVLPGWIPNTVRALTALPGFELDLSGPKVSSFARNLMSATGDHVNEVTLDTWMGYLMGLSEKQLRGKKPSARMEFSTKPVFTAMSPSYAAGAAIVTQSAEFASAMTGQRWTPSEVQEAAWSFAKTSVEAWRSRGDNMKHMMLGDFLKAGGVTHENITSSKDFANLFVNKFFQRLLESPYARQASEFAQLERGRNPLGAGLREGESIYRAQGLSISESDFAELLHEAADTTQQNLGKRYAVERLSVRRDITIEEIAGNKDPYSRAGLARYAPVFSYFDERAIEDAVRQAADPNSRSFMASMPPDMFLALASFGAREGVSGVYAENFDRGMKADTLPYLRVNDQGVVVAHEGRHRSQALSKLGVPHVPVMITTELREAKIAPRITPQMGAADPSLSLQMPDNILSPRSHQGNLDLFELIMTGDEYPAVRATLGLAPDVDRLNELGEIIQNEGRGKFASAGLRSADPTTPQSREAQYTLAIEEMLQPLASTATSIGALRTYSTPGYGMWGSFQETSTSFEAVFPPDTDLQQLNPLAADTFDLAKLNNQEDAFLAVDMGPDYEGPDARPGITVFFYNPMTQDDLDLYIDDLPPLKNVGGFTAIQAEGMSATFADQPGTSPRYTGLRFIWTPEYADVLPEDVQASFEALPEEFETIRNRTVGDGVGSVEVSQYTSLMAWKENYDDTIAALRAEVIPEAPRPEGLWRQPVDEVVARRIEDRQRSTETIDGVRADGANAEQAEASARLASEGDATTRYSYRRPIEDDAYLPKQGPADNSIRAWLPLDTEDTAEGVEVPVYLTYGHDEVAPEGATTGHGIRHLQKHDVDFIAHTKFRTAEEAVTEALAYISDNGATAPGLNIWRGAQNWTRDPDTNERVNLPYWDHYVEWTPKGTNTPIQITIRALRKQMETTKGRVFRPTRGRHPVTDKPVVVHHVVTAFPSGTDARLSNYGSAETRAAKPIEFVRKDRRPTLTLRSERRSYVHDPSTEHTSLGRWVTESLFGGYPGEKLKDAIRRNIFKAQRGGFSLDWDSYGHIPVDGRSAGKAMEMAMQMSGRIQAIYEAGPLRARRLTVGENMVPDVEIDIDTDTRGLLDIFAPIGITKQRDFHDYAIAKREKALRGQGRLGFSREYMPDSVVDDNIAMGNNDPVISSVYKEFQEFNNKMLDFAASTGMYDKEAVNKLRDMMYVPFYRVLQDIEQNNPGQIAGPALSKAFNNPQTALDDRLGVGEDPIGNLYENLTKNYQSIVSGALKNLALQKVAKAIDNMPPDVAETIGRRVTGKDAKGNGIMTFREDGKQVHYKIEDLPLWSAIGSMSPTQRGTFVMLASKFSALLRSGITKMPGFMIANLWRGKWTAYATTGIPNSLSGNVAGTIKGLKDSYNRADNLISMQINSGVGGYTYGVGEIDFARQFQRTLRGREGSGSTLQRMVDKSAEALRFLDKVGEATEMAERVYLFDHLRSQGATVSEAAYHGANVINFSRKGAGNGYIPNLFMNLIPMVPFLNARLQGLYRLVETQTWKDTAAQQEARTFGLPTQTVMRGGILAAFSTAGWLLASQDDRWDEETLERKLLYDIIYTPTGRVYLPRAFEVGSIFGAMPVLMLDAIRRENGDQLAKGVAMTALNTFAFLPIPQIILPVAETVVNYDFFTGSPIENVGISRLMPQDRATTRTTEIAKIISKAMGGGLSPLKIDHLITGYTGGMGAMTLAAADAALGVAGIVPDKPHGVFGDPYTTGLASDAIGIRRFFRGDDEAGSQFVRDFYDMKRVADQAQSSLQEARLRGDTAKAKRIIEAKRKPLSVRLTLGRIGRNLSEINRQMRSIRENPKISGYEKQERLSPLIKRKKEISKRAAEFGRRAGL